MIERASAKWWTVKKVKEWFWKHFLPWIFSAVKPHIGSVWKCKRTNEQMQTFSRTNKFPNANASSISLGNAAFVHVTHSKGFVFFSSILHIFALNMLWWLLIFYARHSVNVDNEFAASDDDNNDFSSYTMSMKEKNTKWPLFTCTNIFFLSIVFLFVDCMLFDSNLDFSFSSTFLATFYIPRKRKCILFFLYLF